MAQLQSIFFRLPRELRDDIYAHYVWEEHGYHHDSSSGKLRRLDGAKVELSMSYTCETYTNFVHTSLAEESSRGDARCRVEVQHAQI
jgi:hypothetical protein